MRKNIINLSAYTIAIVLFFSSLTSISNAQSLNNEKYETYTKNR